MAMEIRNLAHSSGAPAHQTLTPDVIPTDREGAYQRWAYLDGQNAAATARALGLSENTVRSWATRDGWRGRLDQERQEQMQGVRSVAELALIRAVPDVIDRLHRIALGQGDTKPVLTKDGEVVEIEQPIPYQAQVNAANSLLDRFGLTAIRLHQHQVNATPTPTPATSTHSDTHSDPLDPHVVLTREMAAAMTPEQRRQWEDARRHR